jgi:hypothetical protein
MRLYSLKDEEQSMLGFSHLGVLTFSSIAGQNDFATINTTTTGWNLVSLYGGDIVNFALPAVWFRTTLTGSFTGTPTWTAGTKTNAATTIDGTTYVTQASPAANSWTFSTAAGIPVVQTGTAGVLSTSSFGVSLSLAAGSSGAGTAGEIWSWLKLSRTSVLAGMASGYGA